MNPRRRRSLRFAAGATIPGAIVIVVAAFAQAGADDVAPLSRAPTSQKYPMLAQLRGYSASGTHQCGSDKHSCVVTGTFGSCNEAWSTLRLRDCCPMTPDGGASSKFDLNYCIGDLSR